MELVASVPLSPVFWKSNLRYLDQAPVGKFAGMWPSPKLMEFWMEKNWKYKMKGNLAIFAVGNGFFSFLFKYKEDKEVIFRNGSYFFGSRGIYLNIWNLDVEPTKYIPNAIPVW